MEFLVFFFNDTATTEIYTLSLHDALPIFTTHHGIPITTVPRTLFDMAADLSERQLERAINEAEVRRLWDELSLDRRSEEHTSELQSRQYLVCRLLLEKKKTRAKRKTLLDH